MPIKEEKYTQRRRKKEEKKKKKKKATKSGFELATCIFHTFFRIIFFPTFLSLDELLMFVFTPFSFLGSCCLGSPGYLFGENEVRDSVFELGFACCFLGALRFSLPRFSQSQVMHAYLTMCNTEFNGVFVKV